MPTSASLEPFVEKLLRRLRGRLGMNLRNAAAFQRAAEYAPPVHRSEAYENAIADVLALAKEAGVDVE